ncbi:amidohydrolase [Hamadaea tsunoensis]|uniref:amidohydrolase n=1 Tax=Hamadaea tsunoensis TaxID=53368 RepID=UPI000407D795|nr:amidohydrolase [Hamadaea tsunoensis]
MTALNLREIYRDLHAHPELSYAETRTAGIVARILTDLGYDVTTNVGRTGVVGVLSRGEGPRILLRADMDALPVKERTGLPYASTARGTDPDGADVPVMHACGHDVHAACLLGALEELARRSWSGTVVAVFQPAEELGTGALEMIDDNFFGRFGVPDVVLGQHVGPFPAGTLAVRGGPAFAATDALSVVFHGRGGHGSRPETTIDPVVMAAYAVTRLQAIVSREVAGTDTAVVTVGSIVAGTKDNIIPDTAELKINIRSYASDVRARILESVERVIRAEALASGALREPDVTLFGQFPVVVNTPEAAERTRAAFVEVLGEQRVFDPGLVTGSEDVGAFATASGAPLCYWLLGGADPEQYLAAEREGELATAIPSNHSPFFAPVEEPTLDTGVTALVTAALTWLG